MPLLSPSQVFSLEEIQAKEQELMDARTDNQHPVHSSEITETDMLKMYQNLLKKYIFVDSRRRIFEDMSRLPGCALIGAESCNHEVNTSNKTQESSSSLSSVKTPEKQPLDLHSLQKENEKLKSLRRCKICMEKKVGVIFLPCSHLVCCMDCGMQVTVCPVCRGPINGSAKVFM